ncbi:MAG: response regulator transcription factor [Sphingomonadales bacterium]|nr:response regulator transcription factor [Sphingomonadales bacterium]MBU3991192.1 response regulator [Alphaproteobacteria bacterium]
MVRPVYLVDDDAGLRNSLRFLLSNHGREVSTFESGEAFLAQVAALEPGPVLLDVQMAGIDGLGVQRRLAELGCGFPVIIITGHGDIAMAVQAMKAGAVDFLTKPFARADLLAVLGQADALLDSQDARTGQREAARRGLTVLTLREYQVLNELARGHPNKTIGYDLGISPRTVEIHRANVMRKLAVHSFPDALRIAFAAGLPLPLDEIEPLLSPPALPLKSGDLPDPTILTSRTKTRHDI